MSEEPARSEEAEQVVPPAREPECAEFTRLEILGLGLLLRGPVGGGLCGLNQMRERDARDKGEDDESRDAQ